MEFALTLDLEVSAAPDKPAIAWTEVSSFLNSCLQGSPWSMSTKSLLNAMKDQDLQSALYILDSLIPVEEIRGQIESRHDQHLTEELLKFYVAAPVQTSSTRIKAVACASLYYSNHARELNSTAAFVTALGRLVGGLALGSLEYCSDQASVIESIALKASGCETLLELLSLLRSEQYSTNREALLQTVPVTTSLGAIARADRTIGIKINELFLGARNGAIRYIEELQARIVESSDKSFASVPPSEILDVDVDGLDAGQLFGTMDMRLRRYATEVCEESPAAAEDDSASGFELAPKDPIKEQRDKLEDVGLYLTDCVSRVPGQGTLVIDTVTAFATLSKPEMDAFRCTYRGEASFRGAFAERLVKNAILRARMSRAVIDFEKHRNSTFLWQAHANALRFLYQQGLGALTDTMSVLRLCSDRGLTDKADVLSGSMSSIGELVTRINELLPQEQNETSQSQEQVILQA